MGFVPMVSARRLRRVTAVLAAVAALAVAGPAGSRAALLPTLYVNYTSSCTFAITNDAGAAVSSIAPGNYQVLVITPGPFGAVDLSGVYDFTACKGFVQFQLTGPGVAISTTLDYGDLDHDQETATFLPSSTYVAEDLNQPTVARASFTTAASGTPTAPPAPTTTTTTTATPVPVAATKPAKPAPLLGTLAGSVTTAGKVTLTFHGTAIDSLSAGRYTITVTDHSKTRGFMLKQIRNAAATLTGGVFVGRRSLTLTLEPGEWFFYPTSAAAKSNFIVVA